MSIFNSLFGNSEETTRKKISSDEIKNVVPDDLRQTIIFTEEKKETGSKINWIPLTNLGQLNEIVTLSNEKPVAIFKHSTRCSVSRFALKQFENEFDSADATDTYFLDLIEHRDVSNEIANRFQVIHQSPQLLLIKNGKSVYDASHSDIDAKDLAERL